MMQPTIVEGRRRCTQVCNANIADIVLDGYRNFTPMVANTWAVSFNSLEKKHGLLKQFDVKAEKSKEE